MSQDELHRGKLRKIDLKNKSIEDFFKEKCMVNIYKINK